MNDAQLVEALDYIANNLNDQLHDPQTFHKPDVGDSGDNYFMESSLYKILGENMFVVDHDYGAEGKKDYILFAPRDVEKRAYKAACMYAHEEEETRTIQFGCDWFELTPGLQIGHAGLFDADGVYHPVAFITGKHENLLKSYAKMEIIRLAMDYVTAPEYTPEDGTLSGAIRHDHLKIKCKCDGAHALHSAAVQNGMESSSCYSHCVRFADGTKRNSKKGTQGSIFQYLRKTMKMSHKATAKVVVDVLSANYIPPQDRRDYTSWADEMHKKHHEVFLSGSNNSKHMRDYYINHDPNKLGGHCCPLPGQPGSNNAGEVRGREIKRRWAGIVKNLPKEEKANPIHALCACAMDLKMMAPLSSFCIEPTRFEEDYDYVRKLSSWTQSSSSDAPGDILHMMCTDTDDRGKLLDTKQLIGDGSKSFVAHLPTGTNLYSNVKQFASESCKKTRTGTLTEQNDCVHDADRADTVDKCKTIMAAMSDEQVIAFKVQMYQKLLQNTPGTNPGEDLLSFLIRRGQRNPSGNHTTKRTKERIKANKKRITKRRNKGTKSRTEGERKKLVDKLGKEANVCNDKNAKTNDGVNDWCADEDLIIGDDFEMGDLLQFLQDTCGIEVEDDELISNTLARKELVRLPRQLGHFIEVTVDASKKKVTCNCEDYNFEGYCQHCAMFEVMQFSQFPGMTQSRPKERWQEIRKSCISVMKNMYVDICGKEVTVEARDT